MRIIVNGAGIAGPTLAWWLRKGGHDVVLVEEAPALRSGGYIIDFWGIGYDIAEKMGLVPRIRAEGYQFEEVRYVDARGEKTGGFDVDVFARLTHDRFTSLKRSDLSATICASLDGEVETIFGDSVSGIEERGDRLVVSFDKAPQREADLVVGADGLHSRVRALAFGAEPAFEVTFGYHVAAFEAGGYRPRDELAYVSHAAPGRSAARVSMRDDRTLVLFIFRDECLPRGEVATMAERKDALRSVFAGVGWECPAMLAAMDRADDLYFDRISQIRMDRWTNGRTALVGDAAACVSLLAGEGTGLAMAEAYVLAGELHACAGDHAAAFARYEARMMPFLRRKQASALKFAGAFAPKTAFGIRFRDFVTSLFRIRPLADYLIGRDLRDRIELPEYF
jgi:2-polyprenyl-6-methoxyphenol hydroxylase-like FAD-dependent oxidoreductase